MLIQRGFDGMVWMALKQWTLHPMIYPCLMSLTTYYFAGIEKGANRFEPSNSW